MAQGFTLIAIGWGLLLSPILVAALAHAWRRRKRTLAEDFPELNGGA